MVHGKNRIPYWIDRRLTGLADLTMMLPSRLGCPLSLKIPNMGNTGWDSYFPAWSACKNLIAVKSKCKLSYKRAALTWNKPGPGQCLASFPGLEGLI